MEKIKQGKLDRPSFWLVVAAIFMFAFIAVSGTIGDNLGSDGRLAALVIAEIALWIACGMRLRDAGKSLAHLLIMLVLHIYVIVIGCYKSEELHSIEEPEWMKKDTENIGGEDRQ